MKKISILINVTLGISLVLIACYLFESCWNANFYFIESGKDHSVNGSIDATPYMRIAIENTIYAVIEAILIVALGASLFLFNYRFDGVSLREKIATRLLESKEKRAQYRVEKAAADKQVAIEDKQKRLEELQAELDELKKE